MADVFISYSRGDSLEFAQRLTRALEAGGLDVWVDLDDIPAASEWERDLGEGILASECVCFVISPGSVRSRHCRTELELAVARNKRLLPIVHEEVPAGDVPAAIGRLNWIPQRGGFEDEFDSALTTLFAAVRTDLEDLRTHTRWQQRAEEWEQSGRRSSRLCRGAEVREAEDWVAAQANQNPPPTALQIEYISASRRTAMRRQGLILAGSLAALALAVVLGILTLVQRNEARDQRDLARSNELASAALANLQANPELSLLLAVEAAETEATPRTEQALAQAVAGSSLRGRVGLDERIWQARLSPNGRSLAVATDAGLTLYDPKSLEPVARPYEGGVLYDLVFTPDSKAVYAAGQDGILRRFAVDDGGVEQKLRTLGSVSSVAVSQDGTLVAATTRDGEVLLFDSEGERYRTLRGHDDAVITVDFARRGAALASASLDGTVRVWNAVTGETLGVLEGMAGRYRDVDVTTDARTAVTVDLRGAARAWDVDSGEPVGDQLNDLFAEGRARSVDLSPDERSVLVATTDGRARLVSLNSRRVVASFGRHAGPARTAEFGDGGATVVTAGQNDATVRVHDTGSLELTLADTEYSTALAVAPDGAAVASAGTDGRLLVFDLDSGAELAEIAASAERERDVSYSAEGELLVAGGDDGVARVWPAEGKTDPLYERAYDGPVEQAVFDPDAARIATASIDGGARIWDLESAEETKLAGGDYAYAVAWSPDGELVAAVEQTGRTTTAHVLEVATGDELSSFESRGAITIAFDPDGRRVAVAGLRGSTEIRDARTGERLLELGEQAGRVESVEFSPGGDRVITAASEGTRVWSASSGLVLLSLPASSIDAVPTPDGRLAVTYAAERPVEVHECEACVADAAELLSLARERLTREPTAAERERYDLD